MSIGISQHHPVHGVGGVSAQSDGRRGDETGPAVMKSRGEAVDLVGEKVRMPEDQIIGFGIFRKGAPARGRDILEELDARSFVGAQSGDAQASAEDLVQMLLFDAVVLAFAGNAQTEEVAIEREALFSVGNHDGRVINAEEEGSMPAVE